MCPDTKSEGRVQRSGISRQVPAHSNDLPANPLYSRHMGHLVLHSLLQADRSTDVTHTPWGGVESKRRGKKVEILRNDRFVWDSGRYCLRKWTPLLAAEDCKNNSLSFCVYVLLWIHVNLAGQSQLWIVCHAALTRCDAASFQCQGIFLSSLQECASFKIEFRMPVT